MAKSFTCWVIVAGDQATAFRARQAEDLLPTLKQLQRTQSNVTMRWFERGKLWESPEAARAALEERRRSPVRKGREWRPGGDHKDPRARFELSRDEKRARYKKRLIGGRVRPSTSKGRPPGKPKGSK